jgi:hypothetical protein
MIVLMRIAPYRNRPPSAREAFEIGVRADGISPESRFSEPHESAFWRLEKRQNSLIYSKTCG